MVFWQQKYECQACASSQIPGACSEISGGISVVNGRQGINLCQRLSEHRFRPEINPSTTSSYSSSLSSSSSFFYNLFDHFHLHLPVSYVCHYTSIHPAPPSTSFSSPLVIMLSKDFVQRSIHSSITPLHPPSSLSASASCLPCQNHTEINPSSSSSKVKDQHIHNLFKVNPKSTHSCH